MDSHNNSKLLYQQAKIYFDKAMSKYESGELKSEPELVQAVFQSFEKFFTSMGKPQFIPIYAYEDGPLWSEDYNQMMDQIKEDITLLYQEVDILGRSLYTDFNQHVLQQEVIQHKYEDALDKLKDLEMYTGHSSNVLRFGRDDFLNASKIDYDRITGTPLEISKTGLSLPLKSDSRNVIEGATVTIVPGNQKHNDFIMGADSNGFPGNNNEISMVSNSLLTGTYGYNFIGKDDNHGNYGSVLDQSPDTWFEYERINLRDHERQKLTKNLGWEYEVTENKNIVYAEDPKDNKLKLHLQIVLDEEEIINAINLDMYTPPNYGAKTAVVKDILVSDGKGAQYSIIESGKQDSDYSFHFEPLKAKVISILFEQKTKYYTDLGHIYYTKKMNVNNTNDYVFEAITPKNEPTLDTRIDGPKINIEQLGAKVDIQNTTIQAYYPMKDAESAGYPLEKITDELISQVDKSTVEAGIERIEGWRYCIGIKNIEILSNSYEDRGEIVTKPYYFDKPIDRIAISAQETIGNLLVANKEMKYEWIQYYVSIDDGLEWHPITPTDHETLPDQPPKLYTIQQASDENKIKDQYGYIETDTPIYSLRLKIVIERPQDKENKGLTFFSSPSISEQFKSSTLQRFSFQVETQKEEEDTEDVFIKDSFFKDDYEELERPEIPGMPEIPDLDKDPEAPDYGVPPGGGINPDDYYEPIELTIDEINDSVCVCDSLFIQGVAVSGLSITDYTLTINDEVIDPHHLGLKGEEECGNESPRASTDTYESGKMIVFNWEIPYWKLQQLNIQSGNNIDIKVVIKDSKMTEEFTHSLSVVDCEKEETYDCYELESIILQYYNEDYKALKEIELSVDILPYEFDNGHGTYVTVGWNKDLKAPIVMLTDGYDQSGYAFVLHAVGIRYRNLIGENEIKWSTIVSDESEGNHNLELVPGDPDIKTADWLVNLENGDYSKAPSLKGINSWATFIIDNDWVNHSCVVDQDFNIEEYEKPEEPTQNEDRLEVRECYEISKIVFEYYDKDTKMFKIHHRSFGEEESPVSSIQGPNGAVSIVTGWYKAYSSLLFYIEDAVGINNIVLSAIGILYKDQYDVIQTSWIQSILDQTDGVSNSSLMIGQREVNDASYTKDIDNNDYSKAPVVSGKQDSILGKLPNDVTNMLCEPSEIIDNTIHSPNIPNEPPVITINSDIPEPIHYKNLVNNKFKITGKITDDRHIESWTFKSSSYQNGDSNILKNKKEISFSEDVSIEVPEKIKEETSDKRVDIIFSIDTSESMAPYIENMKANLNNFVDDLVARGMDARIGFVGSAFNENQQRSDMMPAIGFSFNDMQINGGGWEGMQYGQIDNPTYGAASLFDQFRENTRRHVILVTDTYIRDELPPTLIPDMLSKDIAVSAIKRDTDQGSYDELVEQTGGIMLDLESPNFSEEIKQLAKEIITSTTYIPDTSQNVIITATDNFGNKTTKTIVLNFKDI